MTELVLALSNDIEGQATCHYIQEEIVGERPIKVTRIGFGLPSGGGVTYADSVTLKSAWTHGVTTHNLDTGDYECIEDFCDKLLTSAARINFIRASLVGNPTGT